MPPRHGVAVEDGDLAEFGPRVKGKPLTVKDQLAAMGKGAVWGQLFAFADERNRSNGWVAHAYKEIFGVWPHSRVRPIRSEPIPLMRSWLRSRDIAFAKSKQNGEARHAV